MSAKTAEDRKWEAEEDARTLTRASEIKADKGRMRRALVVLRDQEKAASKTRLDVTKALKSKG
jgi:hypothetical protein